MDPETGRSLVIAGPNSLRSPDGAWVVEFPSAWIGQPPYEVIIKNGGGGKVVGNLDIQISEDDAKWDWARSAFCGTSGKFIAATIDSVQAFEIPSGKKIAEFPTAIWQDPDAMKTDPTVTVACSPDAKRVAIRSGARLTLHHLN